MPKSPIVNITAAALLLGCCSGAWAASLAVSPADQSLDLGQSAELQITISGLGEGAALSLGAYDLTVTYDPAVLGFIGGQFGNGDLGDQLDLAGRGDNPAAIDLLAPGTLSIFEVSLDATSDLNANQASSFDLVALSFTAIGVGVSEISILVVELADAPGDIFDATTTHGVVQVVPLPVAWTFFLSAISVLVGVGRERFKQGKLGV